MNTLKKIRDTLIGAIVMQGYYLLESILFGLGLWIVFNGSVANYFGLPQMGMDTAIGILFVIKVLLFDATKLAGKPK